MRGRLRLRRRIEVVALAEVADMDRVDVLRAYLRRWGFEVGVFFDGVGPDASDEQLRSIASGFPVFRVEAAQS